MIKVIRVTNSDFMIIHEKGKFTWHCGPEQKKYRKNSHLIIHFPTSEKVSKESEQVNE